MQSIITEYTIAFLVTIIAIWGLIGTVMFYECGGYSHASKQKKYNNRGQLAHAAPFGIFVLIVVLVQQLYRAFNKDNRLNMVAKYKNYLEKNKINK